MTWRIEFTPRASAELKRLGAPVRDRIERFLHGRVANGDPATLSQRLTGDDGLDDLRRFRVGDHRVLVRLKGDTLTVLVVRVGPRGSVYRRLDRL